MSNLLKFRFNPALHGKKSRARQGICSWHGGDCGQNPRWSFFTPMGWQSACKDAREAIEERYGKPMN
ncbi:hypothetical protein OOK29_05760 [Streptomyces phaeochromogenes]|uniref:Phage protein n=1 Tax=Streptomyces phaeochromogenes TaxID=1923 RepID=A0ABZ1HLY4_STRPH|nr:hypothetical protein [Streptomyces phaeochromogenes]MCX5597642.1 hypothetical protein [Streptomyces phaeochromogenes]WSD18588.1 hypothetical protein OHB35_38130 [Streptomyces phaeochromogenes]